MMGGQNSHRIWGGWKQQEEEERGEGTSLESRCVLI